MYEGKLYSYKFPEEWLNDPDPDTRAYAQFLVEDRKYCYEIAEMEYFQIEQEYKRHLEYLRRQEGITTPIELNTRGILLTEERDEILRGYYARNKKPFAGVNYSGLKVDADYYADNTGKIIREVSTNTHPCDLFSYKCKFKDTYFPAYHPENGCKPHSEVIRDTVLIKPPVCTIS